MLMLPPPGGVGCPVAPHSVTHSRVRVRVRVKVDRAVTEQPCVCWRLRSTTLRGRPGPCPVLIRGSAAQGRGARRGDEVVGVRERESVSARAWV